MKCNNKTSGNISRRNFAKTVAASVIAAPLKSAHSQVRTQHIPPIKISSGSVILHTHDVVEEHLDVSGTSDPYPRKYIIKRNAKIASVRVINTDGTILADYYRNNLDAIGGQIKIWVTRSSNANMVLRTLNSGGQLILEIDNTQYEFCNDTSECPTGHHKHRRRYSNSTASLYRVSICSPNGSLLCDIVTDPCQEREIDSILIWMC